jgi:hypothetical protein
MAAVQFADVVAADGPNNVTLDYAAVWDLSGSPDPKAAK